MCMQVRVYASRVYASLLFPFKFFSHLNYPLGFIQAAPSVSGFVMFCKQME